MFDVVIRPCRDDASVRKVGKPGSKGDGRPYVQCLAQQDHGGPQHGEPHRCIHRTQPHLPVATVRNVLTAQETPERLTWENALETVD